MSKSSISYDGSEQEQLASAHASHSTTSAKIRALAGFGWQTARIADALSIRYQHAYNVLSVARKQMALAEKDIKEMGGAAQITSDIEASLNAAGVSPSELSEIAEQAKLALPAIERSGLFEIAEKVKPVPPATEGLSFQYLRDALTNAQQALKKPVNLTINSSLLEAARQLNFNLSEMLECALTAKLLQQARERWQAENREAIDAHNQFVERHGLWSDGLRQF